jgi:hypothetical protein
MSHGTNDGASGTASKVGSNHVDTIRHTGIETGGTTSFCYRRRLGNGNRFSEQYGSQDHDHQTVKSVLFRGQAAAKWAAWL